MSLTIALAACDVLLAGAALAGHFCLWLSALNRLCSLAWPPRWAEPFEKAFLALMLLAAAAAGWWWFTAGWWFSPESPPAWRDASAAARVDSASLAATAYPALCALVLLLELPVVARRRSAERNAPVVAQHRQPLDMRAELGASPLRGLKARLCDLIPGNEITRLVVEVKTLSLPRLPAELEGMSVAHLSDLHFTGQFSKAYYQTLARLTNDLAADLCVVTGDIVDETEYVGWLAECLGELRAPGGVFFVLGNHDQRVRDVPALRRTLANLGWIDLGGKTHRLRWRERDVLLAGNERPWFPALPDLPAPDSLGSEPASRERALRLFLSHAPDQIEWARRHDADLLLAGHTHGGQIRLPVIGPIVAPSWYGTRFASGVFACAPTVMHVSRGVSGLQTLRWNCPPELTKLVLTRGAAASGARSQAVWPRV